MFQFCEKEQFWVSYSDCVSFPMVSLFKKEQGDFVLKMSKKRMILLWEMMGEGVRSSPPFFLIKLLFSLHLSISLSLSHFWLCIFYLSFITFVSSSVINGVSFNSHFSFLSFVCLYPLSFQFFFLFVFFLLSLLNFGLFLFYFFLFFSFLSFFFSHPSIKDDKTHKWEKLIVAVRENIGSQC